MNYFFAKLFEEYKRKGDLAEFNITLFISISYFFMIFSVYLPLSTLISKAILDRKIHYNKTTVVLMVSMGITGLLVYVYMRYIRKKYIYQLVEKYRDKELSKFILYIVVIVLPVSLIISSAVLTVLLNGGLILGHEFGGIFQN